MWRNFQKEEPVSTEIEEGRKYTNSEKEAIADALLREDANAELCPKCERHGNETGKVKHQPVKEKETGNFLKNEEGKTVTLVVPEYQCEAKHKWYKSEGKSRGLKGDNPILFQEHLDQRKRREIHTKEGTPDPEIVSGIYNRVHPGGRKVNTAEQRKRHGASFYR